MYRETIIDSSNYSNKKNKNIEHKGYSYYIVEYEEEDIYKNETKIKKEFTYCFKKIINKYKPSGTTLIIGLGNDSVIGDSLGPETINKLIATNHYDDFMTIPKIALFNPAVISKTGISSYNIIKMLAKDLKPSIIIFIDSLKTINEDKLNKIIEINDGGIIPGSCLNINKEINKNTFNIPIIAIGIPLFLNHNDKLYNSLNIKEIIEKTSDIISSSLNEFYLR